MVINGQLLLDLAPIKNMEHSKKSEHGVSYGLSEAGYDIRIKQDIRIVPDKFGIVRYSILDTNMSYPFTSSGRFCIASAIEEFQMPNKLMGIVHDKSTWARRGLSVFNTVIEPGWEGFLTLELVYHGQEDLHIPAGSGIAQVVFHETHEAVAYTGKYQNQEDRPVPARKSEGLVKIIDEKGICPSALDQAIEDQKAYYQPDHTKRGFTPK